MAQKKNNKVKETVKKEIINWTWNGKEITSIEQMPENILGFVYKITNLDNNRYYYGRKSVFSIISRGKSKGQRKEMSWKNYQGSSKELLSDIKNGARIKKEILDFAYSKAELTLKESATIICSGSLEDKMSYNHWVMCRVYKKNLIK